MAGALKLMVATILMVSGVSCETFRVPVQREEVVCEAHNLTMTVRDLGGGMIAYDIFNSGEMIMFEPIWGIPLTNLVVRNTRGGRVRYTRSGVSLFLGGGGYGRSFQSLDRGKGESWKTNVKDLAHVRRGTYYLDFSIPFQRKGDAPIKRGGKLKTIGIKDFKIVIE